MKRSKLTRKTPLQRSRMPLERFSIKRRPVSPLKRAKNKADTAFSLYIRARDGKCMLGGLDKIKCSPILQCMHLITRGIPILRFDEKNALAGCKYHHVYYTYHPDAWIDLLRNHFPTNWEYIVSCRNKEAHYKQSDYEELEKFYTRELERVTRE